MVFDANAFPSTFCGDFPPKTLHCARISNDSVIGGGGGGGGGSSGTARATDKFGDGEEA